MKLKLNIKLSALLLALILALSCFASCRSDDDSHSSNTSFDTDSTASSDTLEMEDTESMKLDREGVAKKIEPSIVKVICYDYDGKTELAQGSGFFVDSKGTFITNAHVLKDAYYVKMKNYTGTVYNVDTMYVFNDTTSDYAICKASGCYVSRPVEFAPTASNGDTVYAFGYPQDCFETCITPGKITDANTVVGGKNYYSNTAWIDHGSSGGVLADAWGRVIGITTGVRQNGEYVALKYQDFKNDIEKKHTDGKEPIKYFHVVREYEFNSDTMSNYFDIIVNLVSYTETSMDYEVVLRLKDKYKDTDIILNTMGTTIITVKLETNYAYTNSNGALVDIEKKSDTLYFTFNTIEELKNGKTMLSDSRYSSIISGGDYKIDISYEAVFGVMQTGKMTVYN